MLWLLCFVLLIGSPISHGVPTASDPASAAAVDPSTAAAPPAITAAAPPPESSNPAPTASQPSSGGGIVTEHKNPDGSTITVTRFNGPLPSNVFPSDMARLHDVVLQNNLYQAQLLQLQTQQVINQALLRNMQLLSFPTIPTYPSYMYPGQFLHPFASPFGFGYPFFPYGGGGQVPGAAKSIK